MTSQNWLNLHEEVGSLSNKLIDFASSASVSWSMLEIALDEEIALCEAVLNYSTSLLNPMQAPQNALEVMDARRDLITRSPTDEVSDSARQWLGQVASAFFQHPGYILSGYGNPYASEFPGSSSPEIEKRNWANSEQEPILLDLDGNGLSITELAQSSHFVDGGDGLIHRTAWAATGDGVLLYDVSGDGKIGERREYVFTDWAPGANSDIEALRAVFGADGDGKLTAADGAFGSFKVMAIKAAGTSEAKTLAQLGITGIDLRGDATQIELPDGSVITGKTTFTRTNGTTGAVGDMILMAEGEAYRKRGAIRAACRKDIELTPMRFLSIKYRRPTQIHNAIGGC